MAGGPSGSNTALDLRIYSQQRKGGKLECHYSRRSQYRLMIDDQETDISCSGMARVCAGNTRAIPYLLYILFYDVQPLDAMASLLGTWILKTPAAP